MLSTWTYISLYDQLTPPAAPSIGAANTSLKGDCAIADKLLPSHASTTTTPHVIDLFMLFPFLLNGLIHRPSNEFRIMW